MAHQDHYARRAADYARYRPDYPARLFRYLADLAPSRELAWDCGTGNGQAAVGLAAFFDRVIATDPSPRQLAAARPHARVAYSQSSAAHAPCDPQSVDIITAAAAAHWFDLDAFYGEVRRVAKPEAVIALWCYGLFSVDADLDPTIHRFATEIVGPYWPPERCHVDNAYATVPFPFEELPPPAFHMQAEWTLDMLLGYLSTWSSVERFRDRRGADPLEQIVDAFKKGWGNPHTTRTVTWPIHLRVGRVVKVGPGSI